MQIDLELRTGVAIALNKRALLLGILFFGRLGIYSPLEYCGDRPDVTLASKSSSNCSPSVMGSQKKLLYK